MEKYYRTTIKEKISQFQAIEWHTADESMEEGKPEQYIIRCFGATQEGYSICCTITEFNPFFYLKVPKFWKKAHISEYISKLKSEKINEKNVINYYQKDSLILEKCCFEYKKDFYGFHNEEEFKFLKLVFHSQKGMKCYLYGIKKINDPSHKTRIDRLPLYETNVDPLLRFYHMRNIQPSNWINIKTCFVQMEESSTCQINIECYWKDVFFLEKEGNAPLLQASYDIETYSSPGLNERGEQYYPFPIPEKTDNVIYQIATCFKKLNSTDFLVKHLLTLKKCETIDDPSIVVWECSDEKDLLLKWKKLIELMDPDILYQYNGDMFDCNYMNVRSKMLGISGRFYEVSRLIDYPAELKESSFSSSAYGNSEYRRLTIPGRINFDILIYIKREFKENSYKLDNVSEKYLGEKKNDIKVQDIFKAYETGHPSDIKSVGLYCFCEGTRVSLPSRSVDIKCLKDINSDVITWVENKGFSTSKKVHFFDNGKKDCLQLTLIDGTQIKCTKDHKFLTKKGWVEAQELTSSDKILYYPEQSFIDYEKEKKYNFIFSDLIGELTYEKSCIFSRLLGYLLADGGISDSTCYKNYSNGRVKYIYTVSYIHLGTKIDAIEMQKDISLLIGKSPSINKQKYTYRITLPMELTKWFLSLSGVEKGKRLSSTVGLPDFIIKDDCPKWILREFLKGLMGGDGHCPCFSTTKFTPVAFGQSKTYGNLEVLIEYMKIIKKIFEKFNIVSRISKETKNKLGDGYTIKISLSQCDTISFYEKIGYAYCVGKTYKLAVVSSYYKLKIETKRQYNWVFDRVNILRKNMKIQKAIEQAHAELKKNEPIFNEHYSLPDMKSMNLNHKSKNYKINFRKKYFYSAEEYLKLTGSYDKFVSKNNSKSHAVKQDEEYGPCYYLSVLDKKDIGKQNVYDIEVEDTHNFVANGAVVHNCVQDTLLPQKLVDTLHILQTQISMSNVTFVPIKYLIERGQQVKALSQISKKSNEKGYLMPNFDYSLQDKFVGATVLSPLKGIWGAVTVVDFASLYPSIMRAHNLCYTTIVVDKTYLNLPDVEYLNVEIDEGKLVTFAQKTDSILPDLLADLAVQRKKYKKLMGSSEDPNIKEIYNRTQLAYKVSMNSIYGIVGSDAMGIKAIAASVTKIGREMIHQTKEFIENNHHQTFPEGHKTDELDSEELVTIKGIYEEDSSSVQIKVSELDKCKDILIKTTDGWRKFMGMESV